MKWQQPKAEEAALEINGSAPSANGGLSSPSESMTREELYEQASALHIQGRSNISQAELLEAIRTHDSQFADPPL